MDAPRVKKNASLVLLTPVVAIFVSGSANGAGATGNVKTAFGQWHSSQSNSRSFSHRTFESSQGLGMSAGAVSSDRSGALANGNQGRSVGRSQDGIGGRLLGGPSTYEDGYQASLESGWGAGESYVFTPEERLVLPETAGRTGGSSLRTGVSRGASTKSSAGKQLKSGSRSGSFGIASPRTESSATPRYNPFSEPSSLEAAGRIYRSPW